MKSVNSEDFRNVRILDNFYLTSSFFPMPVVFVCTIAETSQMNLRPYRVVHTDLHPTESFEKGGEYAV